MYEVRVTDDFMIDGLAIYISEKHEGSRRYILRLGGNGTQTWEQVEPTAITEPTIRLTNDSARALLDALLRHYQGASDMHTVRADLIYERNRVDKLTSGLLQIALHSTGSDRTGTGGGNA